jgi:hypothetical protein
MRTPILRPRILGLAAAIVLLIPLLYTHVAARVPEATDRNTEVILGRVVRVMEGGVKDVAIVLEGDPRVYYINRGLEQDIDLDRFTQQIKGKQVKLHIIPMRLWSPLNPSGRGGVPIARVTLRDDVLFTSF